MLDQIRYKGTVITQKGTYHFRRAAVPDIMPLARLYRACAVRRGNCFWRLSPGNPEAFDKIGGMYLIMGESDIEREIFDPHTLWAVLEDENGRTVGSFWFADYNEYLLPRFYKEGSAYPREIVVDPRYGGRHIGALLYCTVFQSLVDGGYKQSICDVYETVAFEALGRRIEVGLLNKPSYINMLMLGGIYEGKAPVRRIDLEGLRVWVVPHVFSFCHSRTLAIGEELKREHRIQIERT